MAGAEQTGPVAPVLGGHAAEDLFADPVLQVGDPVDRRASADALLFAARRLATERIAMLFAVRGDAAVRGVPRTMTVEGLSESAAARLLESRCGAAAARVVRELVMLTRANPLALSEVAAPLVEQADPRPALPEPAYGRVPPVQARDRRRHAVRHAEREHLE
ncbi:hypothetical protein E1267_02505 [Nonomuraea longispora]|uniref:Uncharacterized protein n=1 Tax=Nonomuraea longispora TaxID=1848320 RepID=A0A4R4NU63_9ACTN|nr:hypothetical protein E1267_02505 [Nonomuraea longispora]